MANSTYDPRVEPHWYASVVDDETRARVGRVEVIEGMSSTLGNKVVSTRAGGIKMCRASDGTEYIVRGLDVPLSIARAFGYEKTPAEVADGLIAEIAGIPTL